MKVNANFERISVEDKPDRILKTLYASLRNLRDFENVDLTPKRLTLIAQQMERTSCLAELEFLYVYALRCKHMQCGVGSVFQTLMMKYIENFFDKSDVLVDLEPYLKLLNREGDVTSIKDKFRERVA